MATTRKQGATDQTQDAANNQQENHAQTPDQSAANSGAYAQSSYQNTQQHSGNFDSDQEGQSASSSRPTGGDSNSGGGDSSDLLNTAVQAGKKWLDDSGVLKNANQLPQAAKEWGTKALNSVSALSTTQKVVGGALLLAGAAYLSTRGKSSKKSKYDTDYRGGGKSEGYRQGSWAGYAGGKSASSRNAQSGSRSEVSSYGTERRATGSSASYGRSADTDFGSGRSSGSASGGGRGADSSSNYGGSGQQGSYRSGSSYGGGSGSSYGSGGSSASSSMNSGRGNSGGSPNSNEQDYDVSL